MIEALLSDNERTSAELLINQGSFSVIYTVLEHEFRDICPEDDTNDLSLNKPLKILQACVKVCYKLFHIMLPNSAEEQQMMSAVGHQHLIAYNHKHDHILHRLCQMLIPGSRAWRCSSVHLRLVILRLLQTELIYSFNQEKTILIQNAQVVGIIIDNLKSQEILGAEELEAVIDLIEPMLVNDYIDFEQ